MIRFGIAGCLWTSILAFLLADPARAEPPPVEAYAALPFQQMRLSPDGTKLAVVAAANGNHRLMVVPVRKGDFKPTSLDMGPYEPNYFIWKTDQTLISGLRFVTTKRNEFPNVETRLVVFSADLSDAKDLMHIPRRGRAGGVPVIQDRMISILPNDPDHVLVALDATLYLADIHGGALERNLQTHSRGVVQALADPLGVVRLERRIDGPTQEVMTRPGPDDLFHPIFRDDVNAGTVFDPLAFSATDPNLLYVESDRETGRGAVWEVNAQTGAFLHVVAADDHASVTGLVRNNKLVGYEVGVDADRITYLDAGWQADFIALKKALPGHGIAIIDRTANGAQLLIESQKGVEPSEYWVLDKSSGKAQLINVAADYEGIDDAHVASVRRASYAARDGLQIPALVTLPVGYQSGPIPFVVLPHGGPTERDPYRFDYLSQFLASRGYGVLQPQFRGSTGQGAAFVRAGNGEWGRKMQDDITDGTHWLVDQKLADPQHMCIMGWSYGGYASLMGAEKEPSLYRCSVAIAPLTNLRRYVKNIRFSLFTDANLPKFNNDNDVLDDTSPVKNAEKIQIPVLLIHGRKDYTVQAFESEDMEDALKSAKKPVKAIYFDEEDHYFLHEADRAALLKAVETFLATNLGPGFTANSTAASTAH